ncbi:MAG: choice-of-anchor D domain-containing protein [Calditrichaeota bacterium]|nr:choice-of-anchor D domain-containing protein [Calditrichota bacterium]
MKIDFFNMRVNRFLILIGLLLFVQFAFAQTNVSGLIDGETWTKEGSPYRVTGNIDVLQLTIEPGALVQFEGNYSFKVHGLLQAQGSIDDSVIFEAAGSNSAGWSGIQFINAATQSLLEFCRISDVTGNPALNIEGGSIKVQQTVIARNQGTGVTVDNAALELTHCSIEKNGGYGIEITGGGNADLIACKITQNQNNGIQTSGGSVSLKNSIVARNNKEGILLSAQDDALESINTVIAYNNGEGVVNIDGNHTVKNSIIYFNNALKQIAVISGSGNVAYSDVDQPDLGSTNIQEDPLFADTVNFSLSGASPAIDGGDPSAEYNDRYFPPSEGDVRNDMGAYGGPLARKWYQPLFIQPDTLDFADVSVGDSLTKFLTIKNYGDGELSVDQISVSGKDPDQFSIPDLLFPQIIAMADSLIIPVNFHPTLARISPFEADISVKSSFGDAVIGLNGRGVVPDIFVLPEQLEFNSVSVGSEDSLKIKIFNFGTDTLQIDSLRVSNPVFRFQLSGQKLAPSSDTLITLTVYFAPDSIDTYSDSLSVFSNDPDESPFIIPLSGEGVAPKLVFYPSVFDFDSVQVFTDSVQNLTISNAGNADLTVNVRTFKSQPPFIVDFDPVLILRPGDPAVKIAVMFSPDSAGSFFDTLLITSNDPFNPVDSAALKGTGVGAFLTPSRSELDFGTIVAPNDSILSLKFRNSGNIPLKIESIRLTGTDASSFSWWKTSGDLTILPEDDSLMIYVRCHPAESGDLQAFLNVVSNDPRFDSLQIAVTAQVKASEMVILPSLIKFDSTVLFQEKNQIVKIFNRGDYPLSIDSIQFPEAEKTDFRVPNFNFPLIIRPAVDTLKFQIRFVPQKIGAQSATLKFFSNDPFQNPRILQIEAQAVEPRLEVSADTLDYGVTSVFRRTKQTLWLKNSGNGAVSVDSVYIIDEGSSVFSVDTPDLPATINTGEDSLPLQIYFTPKVTGEFKAKLKIVWNNPYNQPTYVHLAAAADSAHISANPAIDFGKQIQHTQISKDISIENHSLVTIILDSVKIAGKDREQFSFSPSDFPLTLTPQDTDFVLTITYNPHKTGIHQAQLKIFSQDIQEKTVNVNLHGVALYSLSSPLLVSNLRDSADFGSVFVDEARDIPLLIVNAGNAALLIDSMIVTGGDKQDFSIIGGGVNEIIEVDDTLKTLSLRFSPSAAGLRATSLNVYCTDPGQNPFKIKLSGRGKIDATPAQVKVNLDTLNAVLNSSLSLKIRVNDDSTKIRQVDLLFRNGGKSQFQTLPMEEKPDNEWAVTFNPQYLNERGLELYFKIRHGGRITEYPADGEQNPLYLTVILPSAVFPVYTLKQKYQMISLPFISSDQTLGDLFKDDLGKYDASVYRFFDWDASQKRFTELKDLKAELPPGKALYLITRDSLSLDVNNVKSVPSTEEYEIALASGWNMIGDPFAFPVLWQEVDKGDQSNFPLYYYNGSGWELSDYLEPYKGYAVKSDKAITLKVPAVEFTPPLSKKTSERQKGWRFRIIATCGNVYDAINFAGVSPKAREGIDPLEIPEPPVIGDYVSLYFDHSAHPDMKGLFSSDFRPEGKTGYQFDFTVVSNKNTPVLIDLKPDSLPANWEWRVVSPASGVSFTETPIRLSRAGQKLRLIVGSASFLQQKLSEFQPVPREFKLRQNYPNPFNGSTTIRFDLPQADRLTVLIYDINGRKIKTLTDQKHYEAGYYRLKWDGTNLHGMPVSSGLYFILLQGKKFTGSKKIILQK